LESTATKAACTGDVQKLDVLSINSSIILFSFSKFSKLGVTSFVAMVLA
jgi:hypothetical protein